MRGAENSKIAANAELKLIYGQKRFDLVTYVGPRSRSKNSGKLIWI